MTMTDAPLLDYIAARDKAMSHVETNAGPNFFAQAKAHVLDYLRIYPDSSGEDIVSGGEAAGIVAHDSRSWGPVFGWLSRHKRIVKVGYCERRKGHATAGGIVWRLA